MKFPRKLNRTYRFQKNNRWYVADLDNQVLLAVNEIIVSILKLCENDNKLSIISKLREMYTSEDLRSAFKQLEQFSELGVLFNHGIPQNSAKKLPARIFVPFREYTSVLTRFANARLIKELSNFCEVVVQIPENSVPGDFQLGDEADIECVTFSKGDTLHWMLQIPPDSGILLLNSRDSMDSLLYQHLDAPIVQYIRSAELVSKTDLDNVLNSYNLMRQKDRLIVDSIWLPIFFKKYGICPDHFDFVPPGLILNISPEEAVKEEARISVNTFLTKRPDSRAKMILITSPFPISRIWDFVHKLSDSLPDSQIVLIGSSSNVSYTEKVSVISLHSVDDLQLLSFILQACDVSITIGAPGAEASILVESLAVNIPSVLIVPEDSYSALEMLNPRLDVVELPTVDSRCLLLHAEFIAKRVHQLLHEGIIPTFVECPQDNWQKCASNIYSLFQQNSQVMLKSTHSSWYGPTVFSKAFNPYNKSLSPCVYELPHFNVLPFTDGFVKALKAWHTDREIELVVNFAETQRRD